MIAASTADAIVMAAAVVVLLVFVVIPVLHLVWEFFLFLFDGLKEVRNTKSMKEIAKELEPWASRPADRAPEVQRDPRIRYVIEPGHVTSRNDGQTHFISAPELMRLYGVEPWECMIKHGDGRDFGKRFDGLIRLTPRYDGDYTVPDLTQDSGA